MSQEPIECLNCGSQYRIPDGFKGAHANCKQCGARIDVAAQREARAATSSVRAAAVPQPATRQAAAPRRTATRNAASARPTTAPPSSRAAIADENAIVGIERPSIRRAAPARKRNLAVIVGLALLALLAVGLVFLMNRG